MEFVLVGTLLLFLFLGVVQVGMVLHVRNVLTADAAEGARHAASLGVPDTAGGPYAEALIRSSVPGAARQLRCVGGRATGDGGVPLARVTCGGRIVLSVLPLGLSVPLSVSGRAVKELPG